MYPRNAASPPRLALGAVVQISDGAVQTSGVSVKVRPEGGAAAAGGGTVAYEEGIVLYTPTQAETNYTAFAVIAYKTGCVPVSLAVVTTANATPGTVNVGTDGLTALSLDATAQSRFGILGSGTAVSAAAANVVVAAGTGALYQPGVVIGAYGSTQGYWQWRTVLSVATDTLSVDPWTVTPSGTIYYVGYAAPPASTSAFPGVNVEQINGVTITGNGSSSPFDV
jgi:hypothetical protein